jgi:UDP-N-acetylglucosamine 2-epimerase (non-hydrolysing)
MEAGNRCYDDRVPEEVNRRVIDHASSVLMPYTERSRQNLVREGIPSERTYVTGNPIKQVIDRYAVAIDSSAVLDDLGLTPRKYFLVTLHRAENVDREDRLREIIESLVAVHADYGYRVICSLHPRTRSKVERFGIDISHAGVSFLEPLGFFDFVSLERSAFCILTDSGTVQEEACILHVPNITVRDVTERPETIECGSNCLAGTKADSIRRAVASVTAVPPCWDPPREYLARNVAETVCRIVTGYRPVDPAETEWIQGVRL